MSTCDTVRTVPAGEITVSQEPRHGCGRGGVPFALLKFLQEIHVFFRHGIRKQKKKLEIQDGQ